MPRIYCPIPLEKGKTLHLPPMAYRHLVAVLRLSLNDRVRLFNGEGGEYEAKLVVLTKKSASVEINDYFLEDKESPCHIHLLAAVGRGEKMDWVLQKATELGVHKITPVITERTNVQLSLERAAQRMVHWQGVIASACEQCGRNRLPELQAVTSFGAVIAQVEGTRFILSPEEGAHLTAALPTTKQKVSVAVGPEGGYSAAELQAAIAAGFQPISLGPRILRTETAAITIVALLQQRLGDLL